MTCDDCRQNWASDDPVAPGLPGFRELAGLACRRSRERGVASGTADHPVVVFEVVRRVWIDAKTDPERAAGSPGVFVGARVGWTIEKYWRREGPFLHGRARRRDARLADLPDDTRDPDADRPGADSIPDPDPAADPAQTVAGTEWDERLREAAAECLHECADPSPWGSWYRDALAHRVEHPRGGLRGWFLRADTGDEAGRERRWERDRRRYRSMTLRIAECLRRRGIPAPAGRRRRA